jgi:tetratricopeptide (TPR) repeat protein
MASAVSARRGESRKATSNEKGPGDGNSVDAASRFHDAAVSFFGSAKYLEARPLCLRSLRILRRELGPKSADVANVLHTLAATYEHTSDLLTAERIYLRALQTVEGAGQSGDVDTLHLQVLASVARLYRTQGRYPEAERLSLRALALAEDRFGARNLQAARALNNLVVLYRETDRLAKAVSCCERVLAIMKKAVGAGDAQLAAVYHNLAALEHARKHETAAERLARRALQIREKALGAEHPEAASDVALLGTILDRQKRYAEAEPLYRRALQSLRQAYGARHPEVAATMNNLAALYHSQGEGKKAEVLYRRVLLQKEKLFGPDHLEVATTLNNLAVLYRGLNRFSEARPSYERALGIFEKNLGAAHPRVAEVLRNGAQLLEAEAASLVKRAKWIEQDLQTTKGRSLERPQIDPRTAKFRLVVLPSRIHRWGVFAQQTIPAGQPVIEYTGVRRALRGLNRRRSRRLTYLFKLDQYWCVDGAEGGGAQYINHSCDPNLRTRFVDEHIFFFSKRRIEAGEELSLDYAFKRQGEKVPCHCGAANCRGTINRK